MKKDVLDPAIKGTLHVMKACLQSASTVKRIVLTSSSAAVSINPKRLPHEIVDDDCWTDDEFCRQTQVSKVTHSQPIREQPGARSFTAPVSACLQQWYPLSKVLAEKAAWQFVKEHNLDLVTICPTVVIGPLLQPELNGSNLLIRNLLNGAQPPSIWFVIHLKQTDRLQNFRHLACTAALFAGTWKKYRDVAWGYVHIEDVVEAHLLAYETPAAAGRYFCCAVQLHDKELIQRLVSLYPEYTDSVPKQ